MLKLVFLLNPVYVTIFWAVVLSFYSTAKHAPKVFLGKFMIVAAVLYLSHFFYFSGQFIVYRYLDSIYTLTSLLVFPLFHIYIRLLTIEKDFSFPHHFRYLILPVIVFIFHLAGSALMTEDDFLVYVQKVLSGEVKPEGVQLYMLWVYRLGRGLFVLQVFYFLYANFRLIIENNRHLQDFYSNTEKYRLRWIQLFNFSFAITAIVSIIAAILGREVFANGEFSVVIPSLVFSILLFFIGLAGNKQQTVYIPEETAEQEVVIREGKQSNRLKKKLADLFEKEMIFKNADLKIWDVCNMLGTNRTYVSRLINEEHQRNFCNHVNFYRVAYAKELLQDNPNMSNEQIAELSGFGSQNSMYRAFQTLENTPLKQYRKNITSVPELQSPANS